MTTTIRILSYIFLFCIGGMFGIMVRHFNPSNQRNDTPYYLELQIEEPLSIGDSLQVLDITKGERDTIWVGYLHPMTCDYMLYDKHYGYFKGVDLPCNYKAGDTIESGQIVCAKVN